MSLNPVHFGAEVIDQFGRYLMTTFPIADHDMETQVREHLRHDIGGERLIAKGPYVYLNRPFEEGPTVDELCAEKTLGLHPALRGVFRFETVHKHQELALRAIKAGKHTVVATGTGSGKTEAFLMPVVDHCLHLRDQQAAAGVVAVVVYPMNALADDQLRRLRPMLAGTGVTFGRYTGVTPETDEPEQGRLSTSRAYTESELATLAEGKEEKVPIPWEECFHRSEIRKRRPRIILTNYSQLEYLLLRDTDLHLFRDAPLRFLIFDEVHTYTGAVGSEVACLIRRLRHVARKGPGDVICVGTSATVQEADDSLDGAEATRDFAWRLFGVQRDEVELVTEHYRAKAQVPDELLYLPPFPKKPRELLEKVLDKARKLQLQDEVRELTGDLLGLVETLCGRKAPDGPTRMDRAFSLLSTSRVVSVLGEQFKSPALLATALARVRALGRDKATDEDLIAEMLCYLTLGALVQRELEPVLRPKLHYFMQGFQGLGCSIEPDGRPVIHFDVDTATGEDEGKILPMALCRSCGQHYFKVVASQPVLEGGVGVSRIRLLDADSPVDEQSEKLVYLTTSLVGLDEGEDATGKPPPETFMCRVCGALHDAHSPECLVHKCGRSGTLVKMLRFNGQMKTCLACGTAAKGYEEIVTPAKSSEVADITILAQSMLTAMPEEPLQKLLVFSDNRQDAAFQAGWMEERSRRFRLRHILYSTLEGEPSRVWSLDRLTEHMVDRAKQLGVLRSAVWDDDDNYTRVRWFLLEEFASTGQRRSSLETLALVEVLTHGIEVADAPNFYATWSKKLGVDPTELSRLVRLILDYYRRHGIVSDELLKRRWTDRDMQVRKGLVSTFDQYRPQALVFAKDTPSSFAKALVARNGRSGAQEILRKGIPDGTRLSSGTRDEFLQDLWDWLTSEKGDGSQARDAEVLVSTTLLQKFGGKQQPIDVPGSPHQIRHQKLGFRLTSTRWLCPACRRAQSVPPPSGACPEYGCKGTLVETGRDEEHFDVHQYTRKRFVPLKTWEHSAQVPKAERQKIEREFKKETGGRYNCLVCTPTLELGVDIGKLEMALMRNVPPTPANYAQRAGRAGRRHRIAVVFTYCRTGSHGRYFFEDPRAMIAGEIRVPAFSMRNEPLVRKHAHSAILTALREVVDEDERKILKLALPTYISAYFAEVEEGGSRVQRYLNVPRDLSALGGVVADHRDELVGTLRAVFGQTWPKQELAAVADEVLERFVDELCPSLQGHVNRLFSEVQVYRSELKKLNDRQSQGFVLDKEEEIQRRRFEHALRELSNPERQECYALSYLSADGFLPGYALARDAITAQCLEPYFELSRPDAVALREFTPANFIYADKKVFRVRRLNLQKLKAVDEGTTEAVLRRKLALDPGLKRVFDPGDGATEGGHAKAPLLFESFQLTDVEMHRQQDIDDREKGRRRIPFEIHGMTLARHGGGTEGHIGSYTCRHYHRQELRLVNLGVPQGEGKSSFFPLCTVCGATRSPLATEGELERFAEDHKKMHHKASTGSFALHVDLNSDTLHLGPFPSRKEAVNLFEAIRIGARHVLDMGTTEIEGFVVVDSSGSSWAVLYDPMPGGSGFLVQIVRFWETICERARHALERCASECERACYSCLMHFRNQIDHDNLDRHLAIELLGEWQQPMEMPLPIPPVVAQPITTGEETDSDAELSFAEICKRKGFPVPPASQFRVDLPGGSFTLADWAYPDKKVLVFIDGMGADLHGDPAKAKKDKLLRLKAKLQGYSVVEITAEGLQDTVTLGLHLAEIAMHLGVDYDELSGQGGDAALAELLETCDEDLRPVLEEVNRRSLPLPVVGHEEPGERGGVGAEAGLAWPELKVALLGPWQEDQRSIWEGMGWAVVSLDEHRADPDVLWSKLGDKGV